MDTQQGNKPHRAAGAAAKKKKQKNAGGSGNNVKAYAMNAPGKVHRMAMRTSDIKEKKFHVPMVDRTPDDPPPVIVAVVGPPGTGKTTLIRSLVKRYTKQNLSDVNGPITVVSGKHRRLTFIECANDMNAMIDIAKIADLVLLMMDGNFGFEMETMEFLNVLSTHGFPRVLGVTTHLDLFKSVPAMRNAKKALKHRFWTEVYQGAKLFYLSGVINGRYPDREILNLARFISVMKFRPLKWRNEHSYVLVDRVVDVTHPSILEQNPKSDRKVTLYGYVHGTPLTYSQARVHIPGVGDLTVKEAERLPDPCPTPNAIKIEEKNGDPVKRRRRLDDKQKMIYAPMSDVGGVLVDKDAVYIDVGQQSFVPGQEKGIGEKLMTDLQMIGKDVGKTQSSLQLFANTKEVYANDAEEDEDISDSELSESDAEDFDETEMNFGKKFEGRSQPRRARSAVLGADAEAEGSAEEFAFAQSDSELEFGSDDEEGAKWKKHLGSHFAQLSASRKVNLNKILYDETVAPEDVILQWRGEAPGDDGFEEDIEDEEDEAFFKRKAKSESSDIDTPRYNVEDLVRKWANPEAVAMLDKFVARAIGSETKAANDGEGSDDEVFGDFEDLEAENNQDDELAQLTKDDDELSEGDFEDGDISDDEGTTTSTTAPENTEGMSREEIRASNAAKKEKMRLQMEEMDRAEGKGEGEDFEEHETWHDLQKAKIAKQLEINKSIFDTMDNDTRDRLEGFRAGTYVRLVFDAVPCEFIEYFDPKFPIMIGSLLTNEERFGFLQVRIKRHRWHKKILKTNDPLVISLGWRRFQTCPVYTTSDSRTRNRMLKYTPEHMHCTATFYGPLVSPNTAFCAVNSVSQKDATQAGFRISATGTVVEVDQTVEIVKKLKLVGYPTKVFKNTAFIRDMFSSSLEVAKFEGAQIKTVSGIRGQIKRALASPEGHFRATFEDKILMSDIIILRAWYQIQARKYYNPVTSLLLSDKSSWSGMRLTGQVRAENGIELANDENSRYQKIERATRRFNPLKVPKAIQSNLPYKSQLRQMKPQKEQTYLQKRAVVLGGEEKVARDFMIKLNTLRNAKDAKRKAKKELEHAKYQKKVQSAEERRADRKRKEKREYFERNAKRPKQD